LDITWRKYIKLSGVSLALIILTLVLSISAKQNTDQTGIGRTAHTKTKENFPAFSTENFTKNSVKY